MSSETKSDYIFYRKEATLQHLGVKATLISSKPAVMLKVSQSWTDASVRLAPVVMHKQSSPFPQINTDSQMNPSVRSNIVVGCCTLP